MIQKIIIITVSALFFGEMCFSQHKPDSFLPDQNMQSDSVRRYTIKNEVEIPLVAAGAAFTLYNFSRISKKASSADAFVEGLNKSDVNWFDRWGVRPYSKSIDNASYIPFYVSMPLPIVFFTIDKKMRKDFFKLTFLYAE